MQEKSKLREASNSILPRQSGAALLSHQFWSRKNQKEICLSSMGGKEFLRTQSLSVDTQDPRTVGASDRLW